MIRLIIFSMLTAALLVMQPSHICDQQKTMSARASAVSSAFVPTFVDSDSENSASSSVSSINSKVFSSTPGDLFVVFCRSSAGSFATAIDNNGDTLTGLGLEVVGGVNTGIDQGWYLLGANGGSPTFTCSFGSSNSFTGITVLRFHPGPITVEARASSFTLGGAGTATFATGGFNYTGATPGLIVVGADAAYNPGATVSGPTITALTTTQFGNMFYAFPPTAQSSISGNWQVTNSGSWGGFYVVFK
jgi:hypothetical protein